MKKLIVHTIKISITLFLTSLAFKYAREWRGYDGIGGEVGVPVIVPAILYGIPVMIRDFKSAKGGNDYVE